LEEDMIILSDLDVERLLPMEEAVEVVEDAFRKLLRRQGCPAASRSTWSATRACFS